MRTLFTTVFSFFVLLATVSAQVPVISSFSPASGPVGSSITLTGSGFNAAPTGNTVFVGGTKATVTAAATGQLTVTVPAGVGFQPISVTNGGLTGYSARPFVVTFAGAAANFTSGSFTPKVDITVANQPFFAVAGDLDGDAKPDMVVGTGVSGLAIRLFRNTSVNNTITFAAPTIRFTQFTIAALALGDMDGDGRADIIATDNTSFAAVYRNTSVQGSLSFASPVYLDMGTALSQGVDVGDLDGDGRPDVVVTDQTGNKISVFRNNSSGPGNVAFFAAQHFVTGIVPFTVVIADMDGDGRPDIGVSNAGSNSFAAFRNTSTLGSINLATRADFVTGGTPYGFCMADLDGDGLPEAATANLTNNNISLFKNTSSPGTISFAARTNYATSQGPRCLAAADLDGDGKPDLAVGFDDASTAFVISVFKNTSGSSPALDAPVNYPVTSYGNYSVVLNDFSMDGKPDMAASIRIGRMVSIFRNRSNEPLVTAFSPQQAKTGDTVTITGSNFTGATAVSFGGVAADAFTVVSPTSIKAVVDTGGASGFVKVASSFGADSLAGFTYRAGPLLGSFAPSAGKRGDTITLRGLKMNLTTAVSLGGLNTSFIIVSDTVVKAIVGFGNSGAVQVCGTGSVCTALPGFTYLPPLTANFSFSPTDNLFVPATIQFTDQSVGPAPITSWLWDFGDGTVSSTDTSVQHVYTVPGIFAVRLQVTTATDTSVVIKMLRVLPPPPRINAFSPAAGPAGTVVTITGSGFSTVPADNIVYFGAVKALVTAATDTSLTVVVPVGATYQPITVTYIGTGYSNLPFLLTFSGGGPLVANTFGSRIDSAAVTTPYGVALADINADGKADVTVSHYNAARVALFVNNSVPNSIALRPQTTLGSNANPLGLAYGDLDGDGRLDMVIANNIVPGMVQVRRNITTGATPAFDTTRNFTLGSVSLTINVAIGDLNADGKPDLAVSDSSDRVYILRNTSSPGALSFAAPIFVTVLNSSLYVAINDFDRDGKPDLAVTGNYVNAVAVLRNTSANGSITFAPQQAFTTGQQPGCLAVGDLNADGWPDLVTANRGGQSVSLLANTSTVGSIQFAPKVDSTINNTPWFVVLGDMDGDGRPDIITSNVFGNTLAILRNATTGSNLVFERRVRYAVGTSPRWLAVGDLDGDGKPDITVANSGSNTVSFLRNRSGEPAVRELCPPVGTATFTSSISGGSYQWQVSTDSVNFTNLVNGGTITGATTDTLRLGSLPSAQYGNVYRCLVNGSVADTYVLKFVNRWTGAIDTLWGNPGNWSCGVVPDGNTDVIINNGTVLLTANGICRSLTVNPGASFTVAPGFVLTITR